MCENFQILKKMKKQVVLLITALTCAFFNFDAASEELISREVTLSNGNQVPASHIFTASESPWTFNLLKTNAPGEWTFYVLDKDSGKYEAVVKRSIGAGTKSFKYFIMPWVIFSTFSNVKSRAIIPLKPSVPNSIFFVAILIPIIIK